MKPSYSSHFLHLAFAGVALFSISGCAGFFASKEPVELRFLYLGNESTASLNQYSMANDGSLVALSPATVSVDTNSFGVAASIDSRYLYSLNSNSINQFSIGVDGKLTPLTPATIANLSSNYGFTLRGNNLYTSSGTTLKHYKVSSNGTLALQTSYAVNISGHISVSNNGQALYAASGSSIAQFTLNSNGSLTPMTPSTISVPNPIWRIAMSQSGSFAYASQTNGNKIFQFSIGVGGVLSALSPASITTEPSLYDIAFDRNGILHSVNYQSPAKQQTFVVSGSGLLSPGVNPTFTSALNQNWNMIIDSRNRLYTTEYNSQTVSAYNLATNGTPSLIGTYPTGIRPSSIVEVIK